jgi:hypothetical protein
MVGIEVVTRKSKKNRLTTGYSAGLTLDDMLKG